MKKLVFAVCLGMAVFTSSSVFANGGNSGAGGEDYCRFTSQC